MIWQPIILKFSNKSTKENQRRWTLIWCSFNWWFNCVFTCASKWAILVVSTRGRVLVGGNNFFVVSNSKLGKVYIITKAGGSWMIRTTLQRPPSDVNVTSFGNGLRATVVKTSQYLAIEARTDTSSIIYVYRINEGGGYFFHSKIELSFKLSYGFCINSRSHPTFGLSVDVYVGNPYRKYRKSGASHDSTGSIDCYDGLTGELRTYTEVPEYGEVKVADDEKSSIMGLGRVLVCNGNYVASVSSSWVRQNHNGSTSFIFAKSLLETM